MMKHIVAASLFLIMVGAGTAMADDDCHVPMDQWQSREAVEAMAKARGWQVSRLKIDDGCYQIRGIDGAGQSFKAKIDPATLSVVKMKYKDRDDDETMRERRRSSESGASDTSGAAPANKLFETGKLPKSVVK
ncbi:PepSY domain-containing protein [Mesorhizobium sp. PUT5]|uniref:PepSY domain-containing protein n=1 Tax=Mesorhizobium sp. PUT5 TaxID=3454629 RepID=UPI003FA4B100